MLSYKKMGIILGTWQFVYILFIVGAFLFAGVILSIFSFYDDYYWPDEQYRKELRDGNRSSVKF